MAIKATRTNFNTMLVRGFADDAKLKDIKADARRYARWLQRNISNLFEKERSVAGKLARNSSAYNSFKARYGFDPRRGHKSGKLQAALKNRKLYKIKATKTRATITVHERTLRAVVPHAVHYEKDKVRNNELMGFQKGWAKEAPRFFKDIAPVTSAAKSKRRAA